MKCVTNNVCMFGALTQKDNKITINHDNCRGCGLCANLCNFDAITIDYTDETIDNVINRMYNLIEE